MASSPIQKMPTVVASLTKLIEIEFNLDETFTEMMDPDTTIKANGAKSS